MDEDTSQEPRKSGIDWDDPNIPVGNAPPLPRWPLAVAVAAWMGWLVFLVMMLVTRGSSTTI